MTPQRSNPTQVRPWFLELFWRVPGLTLGLYLAWKIILLVTTAQPVPIGDSFFYDGAPVNYHLHGRYCNPAIAAILPISAHQVFSAYPPMHEFLMLAWMKCFGPGVISALWMHVTLMVVVALTTVKILRALQVPVWGINLAGLFFFGITFHDRPETVAHTFGLLAVLAMIRRLPWAGAVFLLLTGATSLQTGGFYLLWLGGFLGAETWFARRPFPWLPAVALGVTFGCLLAMLIFAFPLCWAGFREHLAITSSLTGWRRPGWGDFTKVLRNLPALLIVAVALLGLWRRRAMGRELAGSPSLRLIVTGCFAALLIVAGGMFMLTPFTVFIMIYQQPVLVGGLIAVMASTHWPGRNAQRILLGLLLLAWLQISIRALGMSTWGILCARDVSRAEAAAIINRELDPLTHGETVFGSGAHLYEIARRTNITWLHASWPTASTTPDWPLIAIAERRPAKLILTPLDYYTTYQQPLAELERTRPDVNVAVKIFSIVPPPEAHPVAGRLLQYLSWAPIIVDFHWTNPTAIEKSPPTPNP